MTGTAFDFIRVEVPCSHCGKDHKQRLAELVASDSTLCSYCGEVIDLTSHDRRTRLTEQAKEFKEVKKLKGG